eukprot:666628_1
MGASNSVFVELDRFGLNGGAAQPGNLITGKVHINIVSQQGLVLGAKGLTLQLIGIELINWRDGDSVNTKKEKILKGDKLKLDSVLPLSTDRCLRGKFSVPFRIQFPKGDFPPSFFGRFDDGFAAVFYCVKVHLHRHGVLKSDLRHKAEVFIAPSKPTTPSLFHRCSLNHENPVFSFFQKCGQCMLFVEFPRLIFHGRGSVNMRVRVRNESSTPLSSLCVRLVREIYAPAAHPNPFRKVDATKTESVEFPAQNCQIINNYPTSPSPTHVHSQRTPNCKVDPAQTDLTTSRTHQ